MNTAEQIKHNWQAVQNAIARACKRSGRDVNAVSLMVVTKYAADEDVLSLLSTHQVRHIGESRVQQAITRWTRPTFAQYQVVKHFIGHLQKNKAAQAAELFDFIDSIDDFRTAQLLDQHAKRLQKNLSVLVQIKLTDRESQSGVSLEQAPRLVKELSTLTHINPCGYMAIAPQSADAESLRPLFRQVKAAFDRDFPPAKGPRYLSLGMSNDFEVAVEEGSSLPRVGSKLFAHHSEEL